MSIAITEDHRTLAEVTADFLLRHDARGEARALLDGATEALPDSWPALVELGWLGLHIGEQWGGSGFGLGELVVVVEQFGAAIAPGPFVPTVVASAAIAHAGDAAVRDAFLPGLVDGSTPAGIGLDGALSLKGNALTGTVRDVVCGGLATVVCVAVGDDLAIVRTDAKGVDVLRQTSIDPTRTSAQITFDAAEVTVVAGGARSLLMSARLLFSAEATGVARAVTTMSADYARDRQQFGRAIAMFQAVKHHCANMLVEAEVATAAVWDATRAKTEDEFAYACAIAATLAVPAAVENCKLNIQVHGGIGFTWEHDAHLYFRRARFDAAFLGDAPHHRERLATLLAW